MTTSPGTLTRIRLLEQQLAAMQNQLQAIERDTSRRADPLPVRLAVTCVDTDDSYPTWPAKIYPIQLLDAPTDDPDDIVTRGAAPQAYAMATAEQHYYIPEGKRIQVTRQNNQWMIQADMVDTVTISKRDADATDSQAVLDSGAVDPGEIDKRYLAKSNGTTLDLSSQTGVTLRHLSKFGIRDSTFGVTLRDPTRHGTELFLPILDQAGGICYAIKGTWEDASASGTGAKSTNSYAQFTPSTNCFSLPGTKPLMKANADGETIEFNLKSYVLLLIQADPLVYFYASNIDSAIAKPSFTVPGGGFVAGNTYTLNPWRNPYAFGTITVSLSSSTIGGGYASMHESAGQSITHTLPLASWGSGLEPMAWWVQGPIRMIMYTQVEPGESFKIKMNAAFSYFYGGSFTTLTQEVAIGQATAGAVEVMAIPLEGGTNITAT